MHPLPPSRYSCCQNLVVDDPTLAVAELAEYKKAGGGTLVDCTTAGIRLDTADLVDISRDSGVKIVCGTGFYVDSFLDEDMKVGVGQVWERGWLGGGGGEEVEGRRRRGASESERK